MFQEFCFLQSQFVSGRFPLMVSSMPNMRKFFLAEKEIFSSLLIANAIAGVSGIKEINDFKESTYIEIINILKRKGIVRFFDDPILPADLDTTSFAVSELMRAGIVSGEFFLETIKMARNNKVPPSGISFFVYFQKEAMKYAKKNHSDIVVDVNVSTMLRMAGCPDPLVEWNIFSLLKKGKNSIRPRLRYYGYSGFLYFTGRMLELCPDLQQKHLAAYLDRVKEEIKIELQKKKEKRGFSFLNIGMLATSLGRFKKIPNQLFLIVEEFTKIDVKERSWAIFRKGSERKFYGSPWISTAIGIIEPLIVMKGRRENY